MVHYIVSNMSWFGIFELKSLKNASFKELCVQTMSFSTPLLMEEWMFSFSTERINGVPACNTTTSGVKSWTLNCCCKAKATMKGNEGEIWWKVRSSNSLKQKKMLFVTFDFQKTKNIPQNIRINQNFMANNFRAHITHLWKPSPKSLFLKVGAPKPGTHPLVAKGHFGHHELGVFGTPKNRMNETPPF